MGRTGKGCSRHLRHGDNLCETKSPYHHPQLFMYEPEFMFGTKHFGDTELFMGHKKSFWNWNVLGCIPSLNTGV